MRNLKPYYVVVTLNGNMVLKESIKDTEELEIEIYAEDLKEAKECFKQHKKTLRSEGIL